MTVVERKRNLQLSRRLIFFVTWGMCLCAFILISYKASFFPEGGLAVLGSFPQEKAENAIGEVQYVKYSADGLNPEFWIHFSKLTAEGMQFGVFRTPVVKEVKIRDLTITVFREFRGDEKQQDPISLCKAEGLDSEKGLAGYLKGGGKGWSADIDISNVVRIEAINFKYRVVANGAVTLEVTSRRAEVQGRLREIELRGHGTVKTRQGDTLEGNNIRWDVLSHTFRSKGTYVLNSDCRTITGRDICVDYELKPVSAGKNAKNPKEEQECYAMR
jgi:hypothetical protein